MPMTHPFRPDRLKEVARRPAYPAQVIEAVDSIHRAPDVAGVLQVMQVAAVVMGADAGVFIDAVPDGESSRTLTILLACDPRLGYVSQKACPVEEHPWFLYAREHDTPIAASRLTAASTRQRRAVDAARQHGFMSALVVPATSGGGLQRFGVLCLGTRHAGDFEDPASHIVRILARTLAAELLDWFRHQGHDALLRRTHLKSRDLQLLALARRGASTKEIACELGASASSVNSRFQRIKARLGCRSRASAARRAAEHGLISDGYPSKLSCCCPSEQAMNLGRNSSLDSPTNRPTVKKRASRRGDVEGRSPVAATRPKPGTARAAPPPARLAHLS